MRRADHDRRKTGLQHHCLALLLGAAIGRAHWQGPVLAEHLALGIAGHDGGGEDDPWPCLGVRAGKREARIEQPSGARNVDLTYLRLAALGGDLRGEVEHAVGSGPSERLWQGAALAALTEIAEHPLCPRRLGTRTAHERADLMTLIQQPSAQCPADEAAGPRYQYPHLCELTSRRPCALHYRPCPATDRARRRLQDHRGRAADARNLSRPAGGHTPPASPAWSPRGRPSASPVRTPAVHRRPGDRHARPRRRTRSRAGLAGGALSH